MMILEYTGYAVFGLDNERVALEIVEQAMPNIVFLGYMDEMDICKELKSRPATRTITVIMVTVSHGWHAIHKRRCEADDFISKPFDITDLVDHMRR